MTEVAKGTEGKSNTAETERRYWLDSPDNVGKLVWALAAACAIFLLADLFYEKHGHFAFEQWFGFAAFFGFLAYTLIVTLGKGLRLLVRRDENYYGDDD